MYDESNLFHNTFKVELRRVSEIGINSCVLLRRRLVIATRFDCLCDHASKYLGMKYYFEKTLPDDQFEAYIDQLFGTFSTLNSNINSLPVGDKFKKTLHKARKARNEIAHSLAIGMTGCLDIKIDEENFKSHLSSLAAKVALGDYLISVIISTLNEYPLPVYSQEQYQLKFVL